MLEWLNENYLYMAVLALSALNLVQFYMYRAMHKQFLNMYEIARLYRDAWENDCPCKEKETGPEALEKYRVAESYDEHEVHF